MPPAADGMAGHPEQSQDRAEHHDNNADRPDGGDLRNDSCQQCLMVISSAVSFICTGRVPARRRG
jgi:hypothetical protein